MTGSNDNYLMFRIGQIHAMVKQMHGVICANPQEAKVSKRFIGKDMFAEIGKVAIRVLAPLAMGHLWAWLMWLGAMIVLGYKLAVKFIFGS